MAKKPVKYFLVDAFTESPFKGNPAAVCFLEEEEEEERNNHWLQGVAAEFNISQTCFLTRIANSDHRFHLRWFTPVTEVNIIHALENSIEKRKSHIDADKMAVLNGWHRVDCRPREALRRSSLTELIEGYEFYNLASDTVTGYNGVESSKMTMMIKKKKKGLPCAPKYHPVPFSEDVQGRKLVVSSGNVVHLIVHIIKPEP